MTQPKPEPSEAGPVWRGRARERPQLSPQAEAEVSGLCEDEAMVDNFVSMKLKG